ncbi:hypothetical protein AKJ16_DCAP06961 [Drosera capensis]
MAICFIVVGIGGHQLVKWLILSCLNQHSALKCVLLPLMVFFLAEGALFRFLAEGAVVNVYSLMSMYKCEEDVSVTERDEEFEDSILSHQRVNQTLTGARNG